MQVGTTGILPAVNVDDHAIAAAAADHLMGCSYRRLAFYGVQAAWSVARYEGFAATIRKRDIKALSNAGDGKWPAWDDAQQDSAGAPVSAQAAPADGDHGVQ